MKLKILYRGPLSSCNYGCEYCPFAKRKETRRELEDDGERLNRFVDWVEARTGDLIGVFFTGVRLLSVAVTSGRSFV